MEIQGKVRLLLEPKTGISQSSGNTWMAQDVVLDYFWWPNQQNPSQVVMTLFGEDKIKQYNLQPNDEVVAKYHIEGHEHNGRWFNNLRIDRIQFVGASFSKNLPQNQPSQETQTATVEQQPTTDAETQQAQENDGLPF